MSIICGVEDVSKRYAGHLVLDGFSMTVGQGEMVAVTGRSGSGKSTLLNMIGVLEAPDAGSISLFGRAAPAVSSRGAGQLLRRHLGYLFQNYALVDNATVEENVRIAQQYVHASRAGKRTMRDEALRRVGLAGFGRRKVYELSGGEQQRVAVARLLVKPCELVLADEPTGSLDSANRDAVLGMLQEMTAAGKTVIVVTHDPAVAAACGRVVELPERAASGADRPVAGATG